MRELRFADGGANLNNARAALQDVSALFYQQGWAMGTSGNYSIVLDRSPLRMLITASGRDKRRLTDADFVMIDENASPIHPLAPKPSAEALLHTMLARREGVGAVLHTHSVWSTVLSDAAAKRGAIPIRGYEMLKGLAGVTTHDTAIELPIFENSQDMTALARQVQSRLNETRDQPPQGFLLRAHGLYAWGHDLAEARRHVEILEFLLEAVARRAMLASPRPVSSEAAPSLQLS